MTVHDWLYNAITQLQSAKIATARLDALVLLADCSGHDKGYLLAHTELSLTAVQIAELQKLLNRRATHVPLSYLRGKTEFYGREFIVGPGVLVPRPESEAIVDVLKDLSGHLQEQPGYPIDGQQWQVADVGAGSGALGITAFLEQPELAVTLLEIDDGALQLAKANVMNLSTSIPVIKSNLLAGTTTSFDILLCNLPYVPDAYPINLAASHEPAIALFGGNDGLDIYRQLFQQIKIVAKKPLYILTEALPESHLKLTSLAEADGYTLVKTNDFVQLFKLAAGS